MIQLVFVSPGFGGLGKVAFEAGSVCAMDYVLEGAVKKLGDSRAGAEALGKVGCGGGDVGKFGWGRGGVLGEDEVPDPAFDGGGVWQGKLDRLEGFVGFDGGGGFV